MQTLTKVLTTLTVSLTLTGMASATTLVAKDHSISTELCMTAASGNRATLNNSIKNSGLSKSFIVYNIKCNSQSITDFVAQYGKSPTKINKLLNRAKNKGKVTISDIASL